MARNGLRRGWKIASAVTLSAVLAACGGGDAPEDADADTNATINFFSNPDNSGATQQAVDRCNSESNDAWTINYQVLPNDSDGQRQQLTQRLSAQDEAIDLLAMDVNWTAEFAAAGWVREWTDENRESVEEGTLQGALDSATYEDSLYGAPFNTNTQLLWYRTDLVEEPPSTWDEMIDQAEQLEADGEPSFIEVQGAKYEGLVVWYNSLVNSAGGTILNEAADGPATGDATQRAAEIMQRLATSSAANPSLANTQEDQARLAFESGDSAFQINYPFVWASAQENEDVAETMGYAPWPSVNEGEPAEVTIGGINLGVSSYSRNPNKAMEAAECLRQAENQKVLATEGGLPPTLAELYDDEEVRAEYPFADIVRDQIENASVRPQTPQYSSVSLAIQNVLSPPADINVENVNSELESALNNALVSQGLQ
jgi:multiple sugar transport system substrate-binding protein